MWIDSNTFEDTISSTHTISLLKRFTLSRATLENSKLPVIPISPVQLIGRYWFGENLTNTRTGFPSGEYSRWEVWVGVHTVKARSLGMKQENIQKNSTLLAYRVMESQIVPSFFWIFFKKKYAHGDKGLSPTRTMILNGKHQITRKMIWPRNESS